MKIGVTIHATDLAMSPVELAVEAEARGFHSLYVPEHTHIPTSRRTPAPTGTPELGQEYLRSLDPYVALAAAAARTERIRLGTGIALVAQHDPITLAKELATLDLLSGGRATLGIGIGWLKDEFDALGIPFEDRAARTEEACAALRTLWKPGAHAFEGKHFRWDALESHPKPVQPGGVPIVVGGHVKGAARRAARVGDGFFPMKTEGGRLAELIDAMSDECAKLGRDPKQIEITTALPGNDIDAIKALADQGVSRCVMPPPAFDHDGIEKGLDAFANQVMAKL